MYDLTNVFDIDNLRKNKNKKVIGILAEGIMDLKNKVIPKSTESLDAEEYVKEMYSFINSLTKEFENVLKIKNLNIYSENNKIILGRK